MLYRKDVPNVRERTRLTLYVSTALPIIVAVTSIQVSSGLMSSNDAAELVAAGVLSVMVFPLIAGFLKPRDKDRQDRSSATA